MELRDQLHYPLKGLILDGDPGLLAAAQKVFPSVPVQLCTRHARESWWNDFKYGYKGSIRGVLRFLLLVDPIVGARSQDDRGLALTQWVENRKRLLRCGLKKQIERFEAHLPLYTTHLRHPGMPATNAIIENVIRQLGRKIHDTDGYEREDNAWNSLKLLIMRWHFHRLSCSRIRGHNGKSPLELAGVSTEGLSWTRFSQPSN